MKFEFKKTKENDELLAFLKETKRKVDKLPRWKRGGVRLGSYIKIGTGPLPK